MKTDLGGEIDAVTAVQLLQGVAQSKEGFAICDSKGRFTYMNFEHLRMFGFETLDEVVGQPWSMLYDEKERAEIEAKVFPEIARTGSWTGRLMARRRDGSRFDEDLTLSFLPDGGIACNCRDRTAEAELDRRLRRGLLFFREFCEHLSHGVVLRDASGLCTYVNRVAAELNGGMMREAVGHRLESCIPEPLRGQLLGHDEEVWRTIRPATFEVRLGEMTDSPLLECTLNPIADERGKLLVVSLTWNDVTLRRRHDRELLATLERQRELLRLRGDFISLVSHEFRTPLSAIQSSHFLLRKMLGASAEPKLLRYLALQEDSINNLRDLVNQVLQLNRAESAAPASALSSEKPAVLIVEIVDRFNDAAPAPRVNCQIQLSKDLTVEIDERLFRAAIENLVSNALKYSPPDSPVTLVAVQTANDLVITVEDHGCGIPVSDQGRLFEAFFRGSNVGSTSGTGLGLAIVRRAAEFHGGRVEFESRENAGSRFRLHFPLRRPPGASPPGKGLN